MKRQQRMKIMKDMTKQIRSKGRMDADSRWWVAKVLAADCEKALFNAGWEDTMQGEENERREEEDGIIASAKGKSDDQECGGQCCRSWEKKKRMSGCWTDVKQRG